MRIFKHHKFIALKNHPFVLPVTAFLIMVFLAGVIFIVAGGQTIGAADSRVVQLTVDGKKQTLPTRAATVKELLDRLKVEVAEGDVVEPAIDAIITEDDFRVNVYRARPATIVDEDGTTTTTVSAHTSPRLIAQAANINLLPEDSVEVDQPSEDLQKGLDILRIKIDRAHLVRVSLYGSLIELRTHAKTVGDLIQEKNLQINEGDNIQPELTAALTPESVVFVSRAGHEVIISEAIVDPPTETILDSSLSSGVTQVRQNGVPGKKVVTYEVNQQTGEKKVLQEIVVTIPQKHIVLKGTRALFANYDESGIPGRVYCGSPKQRNWKNINTKNAAAGRALAAENGWTAGEFDALLELFACESSWTETAGNPYSGAYGIPQSWPASKMASAGEDYMTNPVTQIKWGLDYIKRVYGSPSAALNKHYRSNFY